MYRRPVIEAHFDRRRMHRNDLAGHLTHFQVIANVDETVQITTECELSTEFSATEPDK